MFSTEFITLSLTFVEEFVTDKLSSFAKDVSRMCKELKRWSIQHLYSMQRVVKSQS